MEIKGTFIHPGEIKKLKLPIGNLASGDRISVELRIFRASNEGPKLLLLAGVHGDEVNGIEILRRLLVNKVFESLQLGSVIVLPVLNVFGFLHRSRELLDGKDLNRSFPGQKTGALASRIAYTLTKEILPEVDIVVDFHTGAHQHYNYPQIRYTTGDEESALLAKSFAPPVIVSKPAIKKSLRAVGKDHKKPILVFEGGENSRLDTFSIQEGMDGLIRLLNHLNMLNFPVPENSIHLFEKSSWLRASRAGLFRPFRVSGQEIKKGDVLGEIGDPLGEKVYSINAPRDGFIIGHNNGPLVNQGDALYHLTSI
ncbi:MAG: succinylglutamate desuccinylase/aspartoacylase family protein [Bacteroidota bacterium]